MKKILAICLALSMAFAATACGSTSAQTEPETSASVAATDTAAEKPQSAQDWMKLLKSQVPFDDQMNDTDQAKAIYGILDEDGYTGDTAMYISTMATPEEIAVFRADDVYSTDALCELAYARIEQQKASYASYAPQEVPKLDSAVVRVCGDYVVVCVSADNAFAAKLLDAAK